MLIINIIVNLESAALSAACHCPLNIFGADMQDDNEMQAQDVLTVKAFSEWVRNNVQFALVFGIGDLRNDVLNNELKIYLEEKGFSKDTKLIDGTYVEYLVIKE